MTACPISLTDEELPMPSPSEDTEGKRRERRLFVFLVIFLFPLLSVALVGAYGFAVWFLQMLFGPPGPLN
ncbi:nitrate reductase NapE [Pseudomonas argentinensis]|uniref:Nitrate reductase NapE n=2 Tax=Phytopseudomonas argentinensis TaxID=289370 RepID=A0A1I3GWU4_9GAMM|nr:nitrate reductase NapE [Pseudomonas argentinensis]